jgi:hypothetical protein
MEFGFFTDKGLDKQNKDKAPWNEQELNSHGYRCPEWEPMPNGKKNVVILGCSHTFGQALDDDQHWVAHLSKHNTTRLRYWNLGVPGASADACVRRLWGTQKLLFPKIVIMCWPSITRREWYDKEISTLHGGSEKLLIHNKHTDKSNFLNNVFWVEKFGEVTGAKTFHCFSQDPVTHESLEGLNVMDDYTLRNCWPYWDKFTARELHSEPSRAKDGAHYGVENHKRFAYLLIQKFGYKFR